MLHRNKKTAQEKNQDIKKPGQYQVVLKNSGPPILTGCNQAILRSVFSMSVQAAFFNDMWASLQGKQSIYIHSKEIAETKAAQGNVARDMLKLADPLMANIKYDIEPVFSL